MAERIAIIADHSSWIYDEMEKYKTFNCGKSELNEFLWKYNSVDLSKRNKTMMLAVNKDQIVGFIAYSIDKIVPGSSFGGGNDEKLPFLIIEAFAVDEKHKANGFGQMLMLEVIKIAFDISLKVCLQGIYLTAYQQAVSYYEDKFSFTVLNPFLLSQPDPTIPIPMKLGIDAIQTITISLNSKGKYRLRK